MQKDMMSLINNAVSILLEYEPPCNVFFIIPGTDNEAHLNITKCETQGNFRMQVGVCRSGSDLLVNHIHESMTMKKLRKYLQNKIEREELKAEIEELNEYLEEHY